MGVAQYGPSAHPNSDLSRRASRVYLFSFCGKQGFLGSGGNRISDFKLNFGETTLTNCSAGIGKIVSCMNLLGDRYPFTNRVFFRCLLRLSLLL